MNSDTVKPVLIRLSWIAVGSAVGYVVRSAIEGMGKTSDSTPEQKSEAKSTLGETDNPYELTKSVYEYLCFNYGGPEVCCVFESLRPKHGFDFPKLTADICKTHAVKKLEVPDRALDIGCAVGRASFELASHFGEVIGIDYSQQFVNTCNKLKELGRLDYEMLVEGKLTSKHVAVVPEGLDRSRCTFQQGDGCDLSVESLGTFGCVLAGNLICRLPRPKKFLKNLKNLVAPGGICVITSPYTFLADYTHEEKWLGGYKNGGEEVRGFETMKKILETDFIFVHQEDVPFMIRETLRKHQWTVADVTVWERK